ncbi:MAG: methyltransferase domain-containing protein [Proteobacteria bacterium]|nr:methyltransferase domain-containing protein [Pseudomonadota bacterium]MBU1716558.1 methyltransferase domain-containing protein [Pseudomonadota bacterium]
MILFDHLKKCFKLTAQTADPQSMRRGVCHAYSAVADTPAAKHPFPVGREFAEAIGYDKSVLDALPPATTESFTGVSNVSVFAEIPNGATVVDLGCGTGVDSLIAAQKTGASGQVLGIDFSLSMLKKGRRAIRATETNNLTFLCADAERLPLLDKTVDRVMVNGIFNLNPDRAEIIKEIYRILKPGGKIFGAELIANKTQRRQKITSLSQWMA